MAVTRVTCNESKDQEIWPLGPHAIPQLTRNLYTISVFW